MSKEHNSQCDKILAYLQQGKELTPIDALANWGIFRLGARIHDLRARGHKIKTELLQVGKKRFASYYMDEAATLFDLEIEKRIMEHELDMEQR